MSASDKKDQGNKFFAAKDYPKAIQLYSEAIEMEPGNHVFYSNRAQAYILMNKFEEAEKDGLKCISLNKNFLKGYHRAAKAQISLGKYIEAVNTLENALKVFPNDATLLDLLKTAKPKADEQKVAALSGMSPSERYKEEGNTFFKQSKFPDAIASYTKAINSMDTSDDLSDLAISCFNNRAACNQQLGNYESVVSDCTRVLEQDPKNMKALLRRGLAFESLERYRSALEDIRNVLLQNPNVQMANEAQHRISNAVRLLKKQQN
ncbi:hypothetical protein WA158_002439 [Blastocystis sp. Blastoise]